MNKNLHISNQTELEQLIGRYFNGETTVQEEQTLRDVLADCPWKSDTIDEARFTMGYFAAYSQQQHKARKGNNHHVIGIAASIAILLSVGAFTLWHQNQTDDVCIAYVNGKTVNNEKEVLTLMMSDLNDVGNATQNLADQLSSLGEDIEIEI